MIAAREFRRIPGGMLDGISSYLLCQIANKNAIPQTVLWSPASAVASWTDSGGGHAGNLQTFLATASMATVTSLSIIGKGLTSISNLQLLPALTDINVSNNSIVSLDVHGMTALETITANINQLASVNVSGCTSLGSLNINDNSVASINLSGLVNLSKLACSANLISTLNLSDNSGLSAIFASSQFPGLTAITLPTDASGLVALYCTNNLLTSIDLSGCYNLSELSIGYNPGLTSIDVSAASGNISYLNADACAITSISVDGIVTMYLLSMNDNPITSVSVDGCVSLSDIEFYGCSLGNAAENSLMTQMIASCADMAGYLRIDGGSNASLNAAGVTLKDTLVLGYGWSVDYNP